MKKEIINLKQRIDYFQVVYDYMLANFKSYFLELYWFDEARQMSITDVKQEILLSKAKLEKLQNRTFKGNILKLMYRLRERGAK